MEIHIKMDDLGGFNPPFKETPIWKGLPISLTQPNGCISGDFF